MHQDLGTPIRLQNVNDVTHLKISMARMTLFAEFSSPRYLVWVILTIENALSFLRWQNKRSLLFTYWLQISCRWSLVSDVTGLLHSVDPKWYRQSPRPSLRVFVLKVPNAAEGVVWLVRLIRGWGLMEEIRYTHTHTHVHTHSFPTLSCMIIHLHVHCL